MANHTTSTLSLMSSATETRTGYMYITPNEGYVVSASDFIVSDNEPTLTTALSDTTTTPGAIGNKVKITVTLTNYAATADEVIDLTINDGAVLYVETVDVPVSLTIPSELNSNTDGVSVDIVNGTLASGLTETSGVITGDITTGTDNLNDLIYIVDIETTINAENSSGADIYTYITSLGTMVSEDSPYKFDLIGTTTEQDITKEGYGSIISYTESVYLDIRQNQQEYLAPSGSGEYTLKTNAKFKESVSVTTKYIDSVEVGSTLINNQGETKTIKVYGDTGAAFTINWDPDSDGTSTEHTGSIPSNEKFNAGKGLYVLNIDVPSTSTNKSYDLWLVKGTDTELKSNVPSATDKTTLNQYVNPTLTLSVSNTKPSSGTYSWATPADITYTGRPLVAGTDIDYLRGVDSVFDLSYTFTSTSNTGIDFIKQPSFDNAVASDWTNCISTSNGGTSLLMTGLNLSVYDTSGNIIVGGQSGKSAILTGKVYILNWGNADVDMELTLSGIINEDIT